MEARLSFHISLCLAGRLLIISLGEPRGTDLTRDLCRRMNALAEAICQVDKIH